jgi:nicotinamidase-related amidase
MYAILVIGMQKDIIYADLPITVKPGKKIIPNIQKILETARKNGYPIIYLCLQSLPSDPTIKKLAI